MCDRPTEPQALNDGEALGKEAIRKTNNDIGIPNVEVRLCVKKR